jgi:hypothetical protein
MAIFIKLTCWVPPLLRAWKFFVKMSAASVGSETSADPHTLVVMRLHSRHLDSKDLFRLGRHLLDDILLQSSQHECAELLVEVLDLGFLIDIGEIKVVRQLDW